MSGKEKGKRGTILKVYRREQVRPAWLACAAGHARVPGERATACACAPRACVARARTVQQPCARGADLAPHWLAGAASARRGPQSRQATHAEQKQGRGRRHRHERGARRDASPCASACPRAPRCHWCLLDRAALRPDLRIAWAAPLSPSLRRSLPRRRPYRWRPFPSWTLCKYVLPLFSSRSCILFSFGRSLFPPLLQK